jgi:hypothetical protein
MAAPFLSVLQRFIARESRFYCADLRELQFMLSPRLTKQRWFVAPRLLTPQPRLS